MKVLRLIWGLEPRVPCVRRILARATYKPVISELRRILGYRYDIQRHVAS